MNESSAPLAGEPPETAPEAARRKLTEAILDNLGAWAFIAGAIALLYLVWATVRILTKYVGPLPGIHP